MEALKGKVEKLVLDICAEQQIKPAISWLQSFPANVNAPEMTELIMQAAKANQLNYISREEPFRWGEDFGHFTSRYPGAMFGLGAGVKTPALHNPDYDFPDEIMPAGVKMFKSIIDQLFNSL
jgi:metal-dependent amidase/aminoacylase/carboxypeptidase family protein